MQAQDVARRIYGAVAGESMKKSRHSKYPSQTLIPRITLFAICLSFSSPPLHPCRFIRPLFLFASFLLASCCLFALMALPKNVDPHLKRLEEIENNVRSFMTLQFEHNNFFRNELKEQKSFMEYMNFMV